MKKISALLAGLVIFSSCVLPVSAEEINKKDNGVWVVIGLGKNGTYYLSDCNDIYVEDTITYDKELSSFGQKTPLKYGDVIKVWGSSWDDMIDSGLVYYDTDDGTGGIKFVDSAESYFENTKELTITKIPSSNTNLVLQDSEGKQYQYNYYGFENIWTNTYLIKWYQFETPFDAEKFAVGQTWNFVMNGEDVILPLEMVSADGITVKPVSAVTANGDADGNGTLDILDIITVNKAILGKENLDAERIPYIDFNQNQVPDSDDALTMLKMIVGLT